MSGPRRNRLQRVTRTTVRRVRSQVLAAAPVRRLLARRDRQVLFCMGDSHTRVFTWAAERGTLPRTVIDVETVIGATALGLANPNSTTDALGRFRRAVKRVPHDQRVFVLLGEVDCGYLIWYRAARTGVTVEEQFEESLRTYTGFLDELLEQGWTRLVPVVVPPPTVVDYATWEGLENARKEVRSSLPERTELTRAYNRRLRAYAQERGLEVLDYEDAVLDPATGLVRDDFRNADPLNHHLDADAFVALITQRLKGLGYR